MHWEDVIKRTDIGNVYIPSKRDQGDGPYNAYRMVTSSGQGSLGLPEPLDSKIMSMFDKLGMGHPIKVHEIPKGRWVPKNDRMGGQFYVTIIHRDGSVRNLGESPSGWIMSDKISQGTVGFRLEEDEIGLTAWFDE